MYALEMRSNLRTVIWIAAMASAAVAQVSIPKMWDDAAMASVEVPLAHPAGSPKHVPASYYYRIPVRPIYKSYPMYAPGREPAGYLENLQQRRRRTAASLNSCVNCLRDPMTQFSL